MIYNSSIIDDAKGETEKNWLSSNDEVCSLSPFA